LRGLAACGEEEEGAEGDAQEQEQEDTQEAELTYYKDIQPMFEANCVVCHSEGGAGPFALDTYAGLKPFAPLSLQEMQARQMPPWLPNPDCRHYKDERIVTEAQVDMFARWLELGMPEGDPSQSPGKVEQAQAVVSFEPTHEAGVPMAYLPDQNLGDDYRCFVLDTTFARDTYLTASQVKPDAKALVHHVLVYAVPPEQLEVVLEADANEDGEGYTCFGAPFPSSGGGGGLGSLGGGLPTLVGTWVPGVLPQVLPDDTGILIRAGSRIVMQMHYNLLSASAEEDQSVFQMRLTEEPKAFLIDSKPLIIRDLDIPAGEAEVVRKRVYRNYTDKPLVIGSVAAHMHLLGTRYKASVVRADGAEECLLEIPRWDFNWQQSYGLLDDEIVTLAPGDGIALECVYDNSPENQAILDGEQVAPRDVSWGEGTLDEMCMVYLSFIKTREEAPPTDPEAGVCGGGEACFATCGDDDPATSSSACLLGCDVTTSCKSCALRGIIPCASSCIAPFQAVSNNPCFETCLIGTAILGGDTSACLQDECPDEFGALTSCLDPILDAGTCDEALTACGIAL
jgi:mono/diheme cytochrome c family protein